MHHRQDDTLLPAPVLTVEQARDPDLLAALELADELERIDRFAHALRHDLILPEDF